jgi:hypothetical protein
MQFEERDLRPKVQLYRVARSTKCVAEATNRKAITKGNIYVNGVQIAIAGSIKEFTPLGFRYSGKRAKGGRELTAVNPFSISTHV